VTEACRAAGQRSAGEPDRADVAAEAGDGRDPHHVTGVRCADHVTGADVQTDVVDRCRVGRVGSEKNQVPWRQVGLGDMPAGGPLRAGVMPERDTGVRPREQGQPRAVEAPR